jgi:predicted RNA-binding protein associated with RNAse of E/G family
MPRNQGSVVDTTTRRLRERNGLWYPLEQVTIADGQLYWGRPTPESEWAAYQERWLLPTPGWTIDRFVFRPEHRARFDWDWRIETDRIAVTGSRWSVHDTYLDVTVYEGIRYDVDDADELADGVVQSKIPLAEALDALHALSRLCTALRRHRCSVTAILREYAPKLPH